MVRGLEIFRQYFKGFESNYILIGGTACEINLAARNLPFRMTRDMDMVICVEAIHNGFLPRFWDFLREGRYEFCEKATGEKRFYRFRNPASADFPMMLELFSRRPDTFALVPDSHLTPIPAAQEVSSLSAILLEDDYYEFMLQNQLVFDGLSVLSPLGLVVMKARAWMELSDRKVHGERVDGKDIAKHKNDIARLVPLTHG